MFLEISKKCIYFALDQQLLLQLIEFSIWLIDYVLKSLKKLS